MGMYIPQYAQPGGAIPANFGNPAYGHWETTKTVYQYGTTEPYSGDIPVSTKSSSVIVDVVSYRSNFIWDQTPGGGNNSPDADGRLTFSEARNWWRNGEGESLMVSIKSIDLSKIHVSDFGSKKIKSFNLAGRYKSSLNDALVYGSITLEYLGDNQVMVRNLHDIYDFDIKPWTSETALRNLLTIGGNIVNGSGNPYIIWIYGKTTIEP
jgi:hypothetical protein